MLRGETFIPAALQSALWNARRCKITRREGELILRIAQGFTNKEIAWQLKITEGTVKVYLSRMFTKLGVGDRYELALLGLRNGTSSNRSASRVPMECMPGLRTPVPPAVYLTSN